MASDLAGTPRSGITTQVCGDAHLMNFGVFGSPDRRLVFDINDFDETLPGVDFTVDLKRLAASVAVAALAANFSNKRARATAAATIEAYRTRIRTLAKLSPLEIWHSRIELVPEIKYIEDRALRRKLHAILTKAGKKLEQDDNFPHLVKGRQARIADKPPLIFHFTRKRDVRHRVNAERMFASYQKRLPPEHLCLFDRYSLSDVAFKAVGVGSVGTFCAIGLFISGDGAPLFLQVKQARPSVLEPYAGKSLHANHGQRVVEGQRMMRKSTAQPSPLGAGEPRVLVGQAPEGHARTAIDGHAGLDDVVGNDLLRLQFLFVRSRDLAHRHRGSHQRGEARRNLGDPHAGAWHQEVSHLLLHASRDRLHAGSGERDADQS
jgi:uncharacterized protein (DUF2252 family)